MPAAWANTQSNLGNALRRLGDRTGDAKLYDEAVAAYRNQLHGATSAGGGAVHSITLGSRKES